MFDNYLKIAFRNLLKQKFYTFINIAGLTPASPAACTFSKNDYGPSAMDL